MEIDTTPITILIPPATTTAISNPNTPEVADIETPTRIQSSKPISFTNGVLKRHHHSQNNHAKSATTIKPTVVAYKECLKNHAASLGGHALDGCGEFMPSPAATSTDPTSLKCVACGCHRNFHRRDPDDPQPPLSPTAIQVIEYQPHNRHLPRPPPPPRGHSPSPPSPPPISSSYYPSSAPHMLLALSAGLQVPLPPPPENSQSTGLFAAPMANNSAITPNGRKRFRTKFSSGQKEKMLEFAERVGWKMQKRDDEIVADFCNEIGIDRSVLKVWMHNNKGKLAAKNHVNGSMNSNTDTHNNNNTNHNLLHHNHKDDGDDDTSPHLATNGSSSSC